MAAPTFTVTFIDGTSEEVRLRPRAQIAFEEETGEALASFNSDRDESVQALSAGLVRSGQAGGFDEWIDSLDSVEIARAEDESQQGDDQTTRPT